MARRCLIHFRGASQAWEALAEALVLHRAFSWYGTRKQVRRAKSTVEHERDAFGRRNG